MKVTKAMKTKTKLWISRDLTGEYQHQAFFWNKKPTWVCSTYCCSDCLAKKCGKSKDSRGADDCASEIVSHNLDCDDLKNILRTLMPQQNTAIRKGQILELEISTSTLQGETFKTQAQSLVKRLKSTQKPSQQELIKFLNEAAAWDEDEDEDEEEED